jgi:hypothetical protein
LRSGKQAPEIFEGFEMDSLLLVLDTILMIFICHWARVSDAAGNSGIPGGLLSYHTEQTPPPKQTSGQAWRRDG